MLCRNEEATQATLRLQQQVAHLKQQLIADNTNMKSAQSFVVFLSLSLPLPCRLLAYNELAPSGEIENLAQQRELKLDHLNKANDRCELLTKNVADKKEQIASLKVGTREVNTRLEQNEFFVSRLRFTCMLMLTRNRAHSGNVLRRSNRVWSR